MLYWLEDRLEIERRVLLVGALVFLAAIGLVLSIVFVMSGVHHEASRSTLRKTAHVVHVARRDASKRNASPPPPPLVVATNAIAKAWGLRPSDVVAVAATAPVNTCETTMYFFESDQQSATPHGTTASPTNNVRHGTVVISCTKGVSHVLTLNTNYAL